MKKTTVVFVSAFLCVVLSGCSPQPVSQDTSQPPVSQDTPQESSDSAESSTGWNCKTTEDGLGEGYFCPTSSTDSEGNRWILAITCTSDQRAVHSISAWDAELRDIAWDENLFDTAKVRIDSNDIEEWKFFTKAYGLALVFANSAGDWTAESSSTWEFLTKISSAETLGFQAFDSEGISRSVKFNVEDSVPIAASFAARGC